MKIALFGGTFDPVHNGHVEIARLARDKFGLDKVIFIPARTSPFKIGAKTADAQDRLNMLSLALESEPGFEISRYEIDGEEISYTYKTAEHYKSLCPDDELYFIMGSDSYAELYRWKEPERLRASVKIIVVRRGEAAECDYYIDIPEITVSSTLIKQLIAEEKPIGGLLSPKVEQYIFDKNLYRGG